MKKKDPTLVKKYEELLLAQPGINDANLEKGDQLQRYIERIFEEKNLATVQNGGNSGKVRRQVDRLVAGIKLFKPLGDSLASVDPVHFGLPWAGVCLLLSVSACVLADTLSYPF